MATSTQTPLCYGSSTCREVRLRAGRACAVHINGVAARSHVARVEVLGKSEITAQQSK